MESAVHTNTTRRLDDSPVVDRFAEKMRTLAAMKPALARLLEWQIDQELERAASRASRRLKP
jgi:hypothetical protein